jgi:hypothetical protein
MAELNLTQLFEESYRLYESFDRREDPLNTPEVQVSRKNTL